MDFDFLMRKVPNPVKHQGKTIKIHSGYKGKCVFVLEGRNRTSAARRILQGHVDLEQLWVWTPYKSTSEKYQSR